MRGERKAEVKIPRMKSMVHQGVHNRVWPGLAVCFCMHIHVYN